MSFTTGSYYNYEINIPDDSVNSNLSNIISRYEPEILKRVLGYELWDLIKGDPTTPDRLNELINGVEYTESYNGRDQKVKWNGLKNSDNVSLIAYYVYFMWQKNHATSTTINGEVAPDVELSRRAAPAMKMSHAWHLMRELVGYNGQHVLEPSLYNFLKKHESTYPEWVFDEIGIVTWFGG